VLDLLTYGNNHVLEAETCRDFRENLYDVLLGVYNNFPFRLS
jgi:hypothetical protein